MLYELIFVVCLANEPDNCGAGHWDQVFRSKAACITMRDNEQVHQAIANDIVQHYHPELPASKKLPVDIKINCEPAETL